METIYQEYWKDIKNGIESILDNEVMIPYERLWCYCYNIANTLKMYQTLLDDIENLLRQNINKITQDKIDNINNVILYICYTYTFKFYYDDYKETVICIEI